MNKCCSSCLSREKIRWIDVSQIAHCPNSQKKKNGENFNIDWLIAVDPTRQIAVPSGNRLPGVSLVLLHNLNYAQPVAFTACYGAR